MMMSVPNTIGAIHTSFLMLL